MEEEIEHQRRLNKIYTDYKILHIKFKNYVNNLNKSSIDINIKKKSINKLIPTYNKVSDRYRVFCKNNNRY